MEGSVSKLREIIKLKKKYKVYIPSVGVLKLPFENSDGFNSNFFSFSIKKKPMRKNGTVLQLCRKVLLMYM